ncbi:SecA regulator SecM [Erwinia sp. OLTSP20]|uniref:secA translation cis-regulator SecM n=1 Tax=unclassified Erwinia TaxID=2622719 RepID=UPI000C1A5A71|nr:MULTISPECIES: secA translation cis-regulator SecM [unclassified Erwinia]PIJ49757.1 SecA regulator SecM [Erwinia sp. OAMSP11]PIJ70856.1 SecA regulator SecM [Erwinia sp. OLSSP12]PIJ80221.1 SecA regulator SecM [Erwinia sp. OLCASP19]PIJ82345.1 SecA regulator SecM [Erwinia sp. OLMTSP26]PIJ85031.1 SecA regulator SecM [Erwinia sp. OLMDSP33]
MISILNRWRQFGRRYFWSHLLLGVVAAGFGLPGAHAGGQNSLTDSATCSLNIRTIPHLNTLALWQETPRRPGLSVDYWHQHAIRTVIRHLSFTLTPTENLAADDGVLPLHVERLALLDTLNALLTHEARPAGIIQFNHTYHSPGRLSQQTAGWLASVLGIRAGPSQFV